MCAHTYIIRLLAYYKLVTCHIIIYCNLSPYLESKILADLIPYGNSFQNNISRILHEFPTSFVLKP